MSRFDMFGMLFFGIICLSALTLILLIMLLAKQPPSRWRNLAMAGVVIAFIVGTPTLLYILLVTNYLFFDAWH